MLHADREAMKSFIETLAKALLRLPAPPGEYSLSIGLEKRHGKNREVSISVREPSLEILRTLRKSHQYPDGLELEDLPFLRQRGNRPA